MPTLWKSFWSYGSELEWTNFFQNKTVDEYRNKSREYARFIDETLALFRGELSLNDILNLPYKLVVDIRNARIQRSEQELKEMQEKAAEEEKRGIRNQIMSR